MPTLVQRINVSTQAELDQTVTSFVAQGFVVAARTPTSATMFKKKEFNILWAVIGLILCVLPLLIYLIVYATQNDEMVEITLAVA